LGQDAQIAEQLFTLSNARGTPDRSSQVKPARSTELAELGFRRARYAPYGRSTVIRAIQAILALSPKSTARDASHSIARAAAALSSGM
jgi:hypothetical protein